MTSLLTEASSAPLKSEDGTWRAVLITPGKGSSGIYTESMLREDGPKVFVKGTHSYVDHPRNEEDIRSPKNLMGVLAEDAHYEEGIGLVGKIKVMSHWREFVEEVAPHTGLSIYAVGEGDYNDDGDLVVERLVPNSQTSVDLVSYPGRPGSKLADKLYEAAVALAAEAAADELSEGDYVSWNSSGGRARGRIEHVMREGTLGVPDSDFSIDATEENPAALIRIYRRGEDGWEATETLVGHKFSTLRKISALGESESGEKGTAAATAAETIEEKKEGYSNMELKELSDQLAELPNLVAAAVAEALAPAEEPEEKDEVDVEAVAEAMVEADLPEVSRKAVYESLRAGGNVAEAIEAQKAFVESVKAHLKEEAKAAPAEETVVVGTSESAPRLSEILNVKVGA